MKVQSIVVVLAQNESATHQTVEALVENPKVLFVGAILVLALVFYGLWKSFEYLARKYDTDDPSAPRF